MAKNDKLTEVQIASSVANKSKWCVQGCQEPNKEPEQVFCMKCGISNEEDRQAIVMTGYCSEACYNSQFIGGGKYIPKEDNSNEK